jgi:small subunit ribosomal protein S15
MSMDKEKVKAIINDFGKDPKDTGNPAVQIAILTYRINDLKDHFQNNKKDNHSRRGLLHMVEQRKKQLKYMRRKDQVGYLALIKKLGLRQ